MMLAGIDLFEYSLPIQWGEGVREGLLIRLEDDEGAVGWGEIAPLPGFSAESLDDARLQCDALQKAHGAGWPLAGLESGELASSVRFGLELAWENLLAARRGVPLALMLSPTPCSTLAVNGLLMGSTDEILAAAKAMRTAGYRAVKMKVGRTGVDDDIRLVRAVRRIIGPDIALRLDANRAWNMDESLAFVRGTKVEEIEYIEEPLRDTHGLRELALAHGAPIALDETMAEISVSDMDAHGYARAVILKPTILGGLRKSLVLARAALALGMKAVVSAAFETGVGILGLMALAAACNSENTPAGLDTYRFLGNDVLIPRLDLGGAVVRMPASTMAQRSINEGALRRVAPL